jgi:prepilin-type N-terminal cleavage/methylation domain-containing protein
MSVYPAMTSSHACHHPVLRMWAPASKQLELALMNNRGFTLIEMVVVTALISIMLMVAIPRLNGGIFSDGTDATARWIIATVRTLKEKAILEQKVYLFNVSPDLQRLWVTEAGMAEAEEDTAREEGYRLPRGVTIDHVAFSQAERFSSGTIPIGFYPQGYSDKAVIRIRTHDGDRLAFFIEPFLSGIKLVRGSQGG